MILLDSLYVANVAIPKIETDANYSCYMVSNRISQSDLNMPKTKKKFKALFRLFFALLLM